MLIIYIKVAICHKVLIFKTSTNCIMNKALKVRLYPSESQEQLLLQTFGCCRLVFNAHLQERNEFYINKILPLKNTNASQNEINDKYKEFKYSDLKAQFPFLHEVSSQALCQSVRDCDAAFINFFKSAKGKIAGERRGFPKFKSRKDSRQSYRECMPSAKALNLTSMVIQLPKIGSVKFRHSSSMPKWFSENKFKEIKSLTVSKSSSNKYYVSILYEMPDKIVQLKSEKQTIGLDFSPAELYVDSEGKSGLDYGYRAQKKAAKKKLTKLQRKLDNKQFVKEHGKFKTRQVKDKNGKTCYVKVHKYSEKVEDGVTKRIESSNVRKARIKLARCEEQIANRRRDFLEKESLRLARTYDKVVVEDLNLKGISKFLRNAHNMNDTSWATFVSRLQAKGKEYGCNVVKAERWFPSSQLCHVCHYQKKDLKLSDRSWTCPKCGAYLKRDENAAINLKNYVPQELRDSRSVEAVESLVSQALFSSDAKLEQPKKQKRVVVRLHKEGPRSLGKD